MKKRGFIRFIALLLLLGFAGCGAEKPIPTEQPTASETAETAVIPELVIGTTGLIENAVRNEYQYDMLASGTTELPLVCQDWTGDYAPLLAEFKTEDAQTWTYTIRSGLTWDDGEPVTAEDILFTLQYDEQNGTAVFSDQTDSEGNVTKAKYAGYTLSADQRSISLRLNTPNIRELSNMTSFRIMPKHIYEGRSAVSEAEARIGCGPYRFIEFNREAGTITFKANPLYPEQPKVGKLVFRMFGNEETMYIALQNGDIDMVWNYSVGVPETYQAVLKQANITHVPAAGEPAVLAFNNSRGIFANEALRKAVSYALDYEQFRTYFGSVNSEIPNRGFVPPMTLGFTETEKLTGDTAEAERYMREAGYAAKNAEGFYVNGEGKTAEFTLSYNAAKENHVGCAELIKTQLEAFGIRVNLDSCDKDSYNAKTSNKFSGNNITMEAAIYGYTAAGMGMGSGLGTIYVDGAHSVQGGCQVFDGEFVEARDRMANAGTIEEYCEGAEAMQRFYAAHTPLIALYWDDIAYAYRPGLAVEGDKPLYVDALFGLNHVKNWVSIVDRDNG